MSKQIDWSKAPEDATHYQAATHGVFECWLKPGHAVRVSRGEPDWRQDDYADDLIATSAIKRPWSGKGLPPVGVVCEVKQMARGAEREWFKAEVLYSSPYTVVLDDCQAGEFVSHPCTLQFRPIRTTEQIAADEREKAINKMRDEIIRVVAWPSGQDARDYSAALYDAGYRKP